jgi:aarF domain-containing kinase
LSRIWKSTDVLRGQSVFAPSLKAFLARRSCSQLSTFASRRHALGKQTTFRGSTRRLFRLATLVAATVPLITEIQKNDNKDLVELTYEQSMLDTSLLELEGEWYGINKDDWLLSRLLKRTKITFLKYIYEPIATGIRFVQLVLIFIPVVATVPIMFLGARDPDRDNERSGTLWWYGFLVRQMERAGPTFIKVSLIVLYSLLAWAMGRFQN